MRVIEYAKAFIIARFKQHSARAVAEQHTGRSVFKIKDARHHVSADYDDLVVRAGFDELNADRQSIEEA